MTVSVRMDHRDKNPVMTIRGVDGPFLLRRPKRKTPPALARGAICKNMNSWPYGSGAAGEAHRHLNDAGLRTHGKGVGHAQGGLVEALAGLAVFKDLAARQLAGVGAALEHHDSRVAGVRMLGQA